VYRE